MSDALNYLAKARPQAMAHYFAFLKDCGKALDPKTRALISVITKAHAQTERGLRQYVQRALRDGCSPAEVLDALLMAFPALGLTKIVWAVDVILAMGLPGFDPSALAGDGAPEPAREPAREAEWHDVLATDALAPGETRRIDCDGRGLFVHRADDGWRVFDSRCPHESTDIPALALEGRTLTCPKHHRAFDIESGACVRNGNRPLRQWPCKVEGGRLLAQW